MKNPFLQTTAAAGVMLASVSSVLIVGGGAPAGAPARQFPTVDWSAVQDALGRPGTMMPGDVYRIGMPRSDLKVTGGRDQRLCLRHAILSGSVAS